MMIIEFKTNQNGKKILNLKKYECIFINFKFFGKSKQGLTLNPVY
jgi:hypothetical protein